VNHSSDDGEVYDWEALKEQLVEDAVKMSRSQEGILKSKSAEWTLDKDGLAMKAFAGKMEGETRYGLVIARRDEGGQFDDPRNLTRGQLETIRDFVGFVLEDSEG
jgi:hypothetical protein